MLRSKGNSDTSNPTLEVESLRSFSECLRFVSYKIKNLLETDRSHLVKITQMALQQTAQF
jgi:hypothetical protein